MATLIFSRNIVTLPAIDRRQLDALIEIALGFQGCETGATNTEIQVQHPNLTEQHRTAIQTVINNYIFDSNYGLAPEIIRLRTFYTDLLTWANDANTVDVNWVGVTYTATKDAQVRILFRRMALLCNSFRDLLFVLDRKNG